MRRQEGLSLVELLISIALGLVLIAGVVQVFLTSKTTFTTQRGMSSIQETGRLAIEFITRDIRMAGYYGCVRPTEVVDGDLVIGGLHRDFFEGVRGYESSADLPNGVAADLGGMTLLPDDNTANIVVVRSANKQGAPISATSDSYNVYAYTAANAPVNDCVEGICKDAVAVAADCTKVRVFQVNAVAVDDPNDIATISHTNSWGTAPSFSTGEVMPMNTVVYFLAEGASGQPTLWQRTNTATAVELLEGVEQMRLTYATNTNSVYRDASSIASSEWALVSSVRVELVVRSLENNLVEAPQPYTFTGITITPPAGDRYLRQVFTSTVGIRSRAVLN